MWIVSIIHVFTNDSKDSFGIYNEFLKTETEAEAANLVSLYEELKKKGTWLGSIEAFDTQHLDFVHWAIRDLHDPSWPSHRSEMLTDIKKLSLKLTEVEKLSVIKNA